MITSLWRGFFELPSAGVIILLNLETNDVWVNYSENIPLALARVYPELAGQPIQVQLESVGADLETLKLHCMYYRDWFNSRGHSNLIEYGRDGLRYSARAYPDRISKMVDVELVTVRGAAKPVSRFRTMAEAKQYIKLYFGEDNRFCMPVIGINEESRTLASRDRVNN